MMQSKMVFVVLFMLSFSAFHDTFISVLDKSEHSSVVHYMSDEAPTSECDDFNELHNMLHFMAIVSTDKNDQIHFDKSETIAHLLAQYSSPLDKTSYKPPIA